MKAKLLVIGLLMLLVAGVTGCGGAHRYDGRLVAVDSLMKAYPDSALALVEALSPDSLHTDGDRAYRDLLLTQARYKCYITATSDSDINRALDYYRHHSNDREKLTRAYIYKGAVMEELNHPDSAMYYYKTAEASAAPDDYANLGQINTRIGDLYRLYYADPQTCYDKYKQALHYYKLTGNKRLQFDCLYHMGGCSGITRIGNPEDLLRQAVQLANEMNDSLKIFKSQELLCRQLAYYGDSIAAAKQIALHCLSDFPNFINHNLLLDLADIYVKSGMPDSAQFFLSYVDENTATNNKEQIQTWKYMILSEIAQLEGDSIRYNHYDMLSHHVSDSILNSEQKYQIQYIENTFNSQHKTGILSKISRLQWIILGLAVLAIIVITLLMIEHLRKLRNTKAIINELKNNNLAHANDLINQFDARNTAIEHLVTNLVSILKTCVCDTNRQVSTSQLARQIQETIVDVADDSFWNELRLHLDHEHNNMISVFASNPEISKKDLKFIELSSCGFTYLEIAMILDYSPRYVLNKRKIIAKKMGLQKPLQDYLNDLMASNEEK